MFKKIQTPDDLVALAKEFRKNRAILEERVRGELNQDKAQAAAARQMMLAKMEAERKLAGDKPVAAVDGKMSEVVPEKKKAAAAKAEAKEAKAKAKAKAKAAQLLLEDQRAKKQRDLTREQLMHLGIQGEALGDMLKILTDQKQALESILRGRPAIETSVDSPPRPQSGPKLGPKWKPVDLDDEEPGPAPAPAEDPDEPPLMKIIRTTAGVRPEDKALTLVLEARNQGAAEVPKLLHEQQEKARAKQALYKSQGRKTQVKIPKQLNYNPEITRMKELAQQFNVTPTYANNGVNDIQDGVVRALGSKIAELMGYKPTKGGGLKNPSRRAYTLDGDRFGSLVVDLPKLFAAGRTVNGKRKFVAMKDGHKVLTISPVDDTLVALLTKRYDPKIAYTDAARDAFRQIVALSDLPVAKLSGKYKHVLVPQVGGMIAIGSVKDAIERLQILCGEREAGNDSVEVGNQISALLDYLLKEDEISPAQHKKLFKLYV